MSEFGPIVDLIIPADILDVIAEMPAPDYRVEQHYCQWVALPPKSGPPVYRCALSWSDGTRCGNVTIDPVPYHPASIVVCAGSAA